MQKEQTMVQITQILMENYLLHPLMAWFIAIRMEASVQLPTCPRLSLLQKETTQGSAVPHIWPEEVLPVPLRTPVHTGDRS